LKEALQPGYQLSELMPQEMRAQVQESIQALKDTQAQSEEAHPLTIRHVVTDHLGTPLALINANGEQQGQVAWAAKYTAWGQVQEEYNPNQIYQPIRFQGQQLDPETNLHYNRFRYYDPSIGQYLTQDPIGLLGGINPIEYAFRSPVNAVDPTGLFVPLIAGAAMAGLAAYGAWATFKGMYSGAKDLREGAAKAREGQMNRNEQLACLGAQASRGYQACPKPAEDMQAQYNQGVVQVQQGIGQISKGAGDLATSVPGTTATGPVPTAIRDFAPGGAITIINN